MEKIPFGALLYFLLLYFISGLGVVFMTDGRGYEPEAMLLIVAFPWLTITLMGLDEFYSVIRYMLVSRRFKGQLAVVISEDK